MEGCLVSPSAREGKVRHTRKLVYKLILYLYQLRLNSVATLRTLTKMAQSKQMRISLTERGRDMFCPQLHSTRNPCAQNHIALLWGLSLPSLPLGLLCLRSSRCYHCNLGNKKVDERYHGYLGSKMGELCQRVWFSSPYPCLSFSIPILITSAFIPAYFHP